MKKWPIVLCLAVALPALTAAPAPGQKADEKKAGKAGRPSVETFTDPDKAGPDYKIQGEYVGEVSNQQKYGIQVVAEGNGAFSMRALRGGLPGDGWDGQTQLKFTVKTANGKTTFEGEQATGEIANGTLTARLNSGETAKFERVVRRGPSEGQKPPAGAVVLFDGKTADAWDNGKVENGWLSVMVPRGQTSKQTFGDCTLHVEFMTPFMPRARGQGRGNSGVYLQGRYEVQVLDSFGLEGKNNECGGLYELSDPKVNMCYPPLQWQTYDIHYTAARYDQGGKKVANARITVRHNGIVVQDNVELTRGTRAAPVEEGVAKGPIYLQNHGNPVYYRNIWVVERK